MKLEHFFFFSWRLITSQYRTLMKEIEEEQIDGEIYHVHGILEESIL